MKRGDPCPECGYELHWVKVWVNYRNGAQLDEPYEALRCSRCSFLDHREDYPITA